MNKKVTNKILWLFALGQLGWSLLAGIITNRFTFFYEPPAEELAKGQLLFIPQGRAVLGIITVIGLISAIGRILDAVTDPLIASKSDSLKHKRGRRIPFMRWAAVPFGLLTILLFIAPIAKQSHINSIYIGIIYMLFYIFFTLYCTPYNALIPVLGRTQENRTKVSTYISLTFIVGNTMSFSLPVIAGMFESFGYVNSNRIAVTILSAIAVVCMLIPAFFIKETDFDKSEPVKTNPIKSLSKTFENKHFRVFVCSDVLYWVAMTLFQTGMSYYVVSLLKLKDSMTIVLMAIMTLCSLVFYPFVGKVAKKTGKKKLLMFGFVFFSITYIFTSVSGKLGLPPMLNGVMISVLAAMPMAILGILPSAIVADIAECDAIRTNENREGMFYAARTFAFKMGQSIALILFTSIRTIGVEKNIGLRLTAIIACVFCLAGAFVLSKYNEKSVYKSIGVGENKDE